MQDPARQLGCEVVADRGERPQRRVDRAGFSTSPRTTMAAACSALIAGNGLSRRDGAIIGVRTSGIWMLVR